MGFAKHVTTRFDAHVGHSVIASGNRNALHGAAGPHGSTEHLETHVFHDVAHIGELHAVTGVGAIRAVALHRLVPGQAWKRQWQINPLHRFPNGSNQTLIELEDLLLAHEAHLHVQLRELRLSICPQVFIAEAASHLVVPLNAAHHQQLLKQLRGLGKGKPFTTADAAWKDVIPGTFWC